MKNHLARFTFSLVLFSAIFFAAVSLSAADFGPPEFRKADSKPFQISFMIDHSDRDIKFDAFDMTVTDPYDPNHRNPYSYVYREESITQNNGGGSFLFRFDYMMSRVKLNADLGWFSNSGSSKTGGLVGAGAYINVLDDAAVDLSIPVNIRYMFGIETVTTEAIPVEIGPITIICQGTETDKSTSLEANAGVILSKNFKAGKSLEILPYGGLYLSYVKYWTDIDGQIIYNDPDNPIILLSGSTVGAAKDPFSVLIGVSFNIKKRVELRAEGRFIGESGYSISAGYKF